MEVILDFLGECWQKLGLPEQVQFDNARAVVGWGPAARYLSRVLRLCLRFGIEVLLIPPAQWQYRELQRLVSATPVPAPLLPGQCPAPRAAAFAGGRQYPAQSTASRPPDSCSTSPTDQDPQTATQLCRSHRTPEHRRGLYLFLPTGHSSWQCPSAQSDLLCRQTCERRICVRPVRSKPLEEVGAERRKSFFFRNCISMQVKDTTSSGIATTPASLVNGRQPLPSACAWYTQVESGKRSRSSRTGRQKRSGK
jgi:hypothetical protein